MDQKDLKARLDLAVSAARGAGQKTLAYFNRSNFDIEWKQDGTPVTVADREAEAYLREQIETHFPSDAILGEEFPERPGTSGYRWILDPIDGTKSFVHGVPLYGTLVGVEYERSCVIGAMAFPALGEYIYAAKGYGTWHGQGAAEPRRARVSSVSRLADGLFCMTSPTEFMEAGRQSAYERLSTQARLTRGWGDCYGYLLVATGRAEVMVDPVLSIWDMAALLPILEEAGGSFTDWQGRATIYGKDGIGTNGHVLAEVLAITRGA